MKRGKKTVKPQPMHQCEVKSNPDRPLLSQDIAWWFEKNWDDKTKEDIRGKLGVKKKHRNASMSITFTYLPDKHPTDSIRGPSQERLVLMRGEGDPNELEHSLSAMDSE